MTSTRQVRRVRACVMRVNSKNTITVEVKFSPILQITDTKTGKRQICVLQRCFFVFLSSNLTYVNGRSHTHTHTYTLQSARPKEAGVLAPAKPLLPPHTHRHTIFICQEQKVFPIFRSIKDRINKPAGKHISYLSSLFNLS